MSDERFNQLYQRCWRIIQKFRLHRQSELRRRWVEVMERRTGEACWFAPRLTYV